MQSSEALTAFVVVVNSYGTFSTVSSLGTFIVLIKVLSFTVCPYVKPYGKF